MALFEGQTNLFYTSKTHQQVLLGNIKANQWPQGYNYPSSGNTLVATTNAEKANHQNKNFSICFNTALLQLLQNEYDLLVGVSVTVPLLLTTSLVL